jgi:MFS family permease
MATDADDEYNIPVVVGGLIAGVFFVGLGGGVAFPTLPTLGTVLDLSPVVVGIILSMASFSRLIANTPAGQIIDRRGARLPLIIGIAVGGMGSFGYILALYAHLIPLFGAAEIFIVSRTIWGIGSAFVFVGAFGTVIHVTSENTRGKWVGYFRGGQALGFPAGLILGGVITDLYGYAAAFALSGTAGLVGAVIGILVFPTVSGSINEPASLREVPGIVSSDIRILVIGGVNFTIRLLYLGVLLSTIVLYLQANEIEIAWISAVGASGLFLATSALFSSATTLISGNLSDRVSNRATIPIPALGIFALGFVLLGTVPTLLATMVGVACIGIGVGGTNPPLLAYLGDISSSDDIGKMGGVYNVFGDIGSTIGPVLAVPIGAIIGYRSLFFVSAGLSVVVLLLITHLLVIQSPSPTDSAATAGD